MLRRRKQGNDEDGGSKDRQQQQEDGNSGSNGENSKQQQQGGKDSIKIGKDEKGKSSMVPGIPVRAREKPKWRCLDTCCWLIGYMCVMWWLFLVLYNAVPSLPQYVTEAITGPLPELPGTRLAREGLRVKHPVVFVPGIVTGGLELWAGRPCAEGLFRKRLWGGTFGEVYKRPLCWLEHMRLDNETGLDPAGIRVRAVSGLVAADYFAPGYFVWAVLIDNLARLGYEEKSMHMASYDWRLSFQNTESRDKSLSRLKSTIELLVSTNNNEKVVVIPHSMGALYFLHFMKWVEAPISAGGAGAGEGWVAKHIKSVMNIGGPFLGVPKAFAGLFSAEAKDIAVARAVAPGVLDSELFGLQTLQHIMSVTRTWDATMSMLPRGGEVIWGDLDSSPEEGYDCSGKKPKVEEVTECQTKNITDGKELGPHGKPMAHYGRMVSFGKDSVQKASSALDRKIDFKVRCCFTPFSLHANASFQQNIDKQTPVRENVSCGDVWTEYHEMSWESVQAVADGKVYTSSGMLDVLRFVAPQMMKRADANWAYEIADDLSDPKYQHYKYWSNPLESTLPNAPDMEIFCLYGVGILTERSYVYKLSSDNDTCYIPFRIDASAEKDSEGCLKGGVHFVDGDETVPVLSAGFMCAKPWQGKTRFNPSNISSFTREFQHAPPANLLEGRGTQSGSHVDIMGNFALIEDVLRVAAGASGRDLGGDRVVSNLPKWSERIKLKL
ncbi:phospholipid:diacylglycerol acyltransferase 1 isoform X1 [Selaginella moellendorffii]|uniref:phospholipid:diacylglycerol acyltransferase 1 isoform X1 n=1 Tax=Selaginella moellendorffii TaxID=88036 RepID=UPI000D1C9053|nr:phospholipid:diacylglycerol acyltransferase 1 isoform X1 [Selaginella moellendorffii]|eukprot:XP_024531564.1 phospholipid:diacylglycerol acyltransferase 1 isoform X1 [Selaginella moellendorffii]